MAWASAAVNRENHGQGMAMARRRRTLSGERRFSEPGMLVPGSPSRITRVTSSTLGRLPESVNQNLHRPAVKSRGWGDSTPAAGPSPRPMTS